MISKAQIKRIAALHQKKYRVAQNQFIVEGVKMVQEALNSSFKVLEVIGTEELISEIKFSNKVSAKTDDLKRLSALKTPPGILAVIEIPNKNETTNTNTPAFYLENINDPGNLGTILRTAYWFGVKEIYCSPQTVDLFNPKVVQATMGAIFHVNLIELELADFIHQCIQNQIIVFGADMEGINYQEVPSNKPIAIVMGSESSGLSDQANQLINHKISIPSKSNAESLNVAMAAGILMSRFA